MVQWNYRFLRIKGILNGCGGKRGKSFDGNENREKMLYIVVFILIGILLTLIFGMFSTLEITGGALSTIEIAHFLISLFVMIATVGAALAAMVSANAAKNSLEEQGRNNKRAIMPFLVIDNKEYELEYDPKEPFYKLNWESGNFDLTDKLFSLGSNLEVINISGGTAKNITVKTTIENTTQLIEKLKGIDDTFSISTGIHPFYNDSEELFIDEIFISSKTNRINISEKYRLNNFYPEDFLFLDANGGRKEIRIPDVFLVLFNFLVYHYQSNLDVFPTLKITLLYEDIIGTSYEQSYRFSLIGFNKKTSSSANDKVNFKFKITAI